MDAQHCTGKCFSATMSGGSRWLAFSLQLARLLMYAPTIPVRRHSNTLNASTGQGWLHYWQLQRGAWLRRLDSRVGELQSEQRLRPEIAILLLLLRHRHKILGSMPRCTAAACTRATVEARALAASAHAITQTRASWIAPSSRFLGSALAWLTPLCAPLTLADFHASATVSSIPAQPSGRARARCSGGTVCTWATRAYQSLVPSRPRRACAASAPPRPSSPWTPT